MAMAYRLPTYTVATVKRLRRRRDGLRYELLDGVLLVTPQPAHLHQVVATRFLVPLHQALAVTGLASVVGPGEIQIGARNLLDPDILVLPASYPLETPWKRMRDWWLAVEVLSRSTRVYDREYKVGAYLAFGVDEVWLANPTRKEVRRWNQRGVADEPCTDILRWRPLGREPEIEVNLREIFRGI